MRFPASAADPFHETASRSEPILLQLSLTKNCNQIPVISNHQQKDPALALKACAPLATVP